LLQARDIELHDHRTVEQGELSMPVGEAWNDRGFLFDSRDDVYTKYWNSGLMDYWNFGIQQSRNPLLQ